MKQFILQHEQRIEQVLRSNGGSEALRAYHERQIGYLQAERFAHLLVTLAFAVFTLAAFGVCLLQPGIATGALLLLLLALLVPYVFHYYLLENSVQRWYGIARQLEQLELGVDRRSP
ncbi:MAG: hypothetical protein JXR83_15455 [Deltaproteobacteria bacterium]|nr:hypothetical protein [Deltaproteobacteria bacterium]